MLALASGKEVIGWHCRNAGYYVKGEIAKGIRSDVVSWRELTVEEKEPD